MTLPCQDNGLADALESWLIHLAAEHKSKDTIRTYEASARALLKWCAAEGRPAVLDRPTVAAFLAALLTSRSAATANIRFRSLRRFAGWMADEDLAGSNALAGMKPPKLDKKIVPKLTDGDLKALLRACDGKRLCDRRDEAIVRLAAEAICRAEELLACETDDVDMRRFVVDIRRGKGGRGRKIPFGAETGRALDRYLRLRKAYAKPNVAAFWVTAQGRPLGYAGLYTGLRRRAERAGVKHFHPHRLRHTGASRWLDAGGSEGGLMRVAGWSSRDMLTRYVEDTAQERAIKEARGLGLGDI